MTVREAFEAAGHPVPEGAKILCFSQGEKDWRHTGLRDSRNCPISGLFQACHRGVWAWDISSAAWNGMDLSNLPAIDAYDALPAVVQQVVKR